MVKITFIEANGAEHIVDATIGQSVMEAAVWNHVPGIHANCGGDCGCATCQVFVDETWRSRVSDKSSKEKATLRFAWRTNDNSRLSCQLKVDETMDGLVVRLPERQY